MATIATLVTDLQTYTDRPATILTTALGELFVNSAIDRMQEKHAWRGQQITAELAYLASDNGIALPTDFISEEAVSLKNTSVTDGSRNLVPVPRLTRSMWIERLHARDPEQKEFGVDATGFPYSGDRFYYLWDEKLFYVPSAAGTLALDYHQRLAALTGTGQNFFTIQYPHVVRWGALVEAWYYLHEEDRGENFAEKRFQALLADAIRNDIQLVSSGGQRSRGA